MRPEAIGLKLEARDWIFEVEGQRPEAGGWRLEAKGWQGRGGWMDGQTDVQKSPHVFYRTSSPL